MISSGDKILFIDDEKNLLDGIRRQLRKDYQMVMAVGGEEGIRTMIHDGSFAVIVSDFHMPKIDGVKVLRVAKKCCPDAVRVMLSGMADLNIAIDAVNQGNIFRLLTKPCTREMLVSVLDASLGQYRLRQGEKMLLENTLKGSISVLVDILSLTNPVAFSRAKRISYLAAQVATLIELPDSWRVEVAALLSQIGCVTIPPDTLEKVYTNQDLSAVEKTMLQTFPIVGHDLISKIPRLENIADMIANQHAAYSKESRDVAWEDREICVVGAEILRVVIDFDSLLSRGESRANTFKELYRRVDVYNPKLLDVLKQIAIPEVEKIVSRVEIERLKIGMVLEEDVRSFRNVLLAKKEQVLNETMLIMFANYYRHKDLQSSILVAHQY